jgi:hypothetical protein
MKRFIKKHFVDLFLAIVFIGILPSSISKNHPIYAQIISIIMFLVICVIFDYTLEKIRSKRRR